MNNRLQRLYFFLVVWFTMISCLTGWGQNIALIKSKKDFLDLLYPGASVAKLYPGWPLYESRMIYFPDPAQAEQTGTSAQIKQHGFGWNMDGTYIQPPNIYYLQSGFFCKREWEFEKTTHIPFRFRLGSLADCNAMEGKR
ncbi:MAG TPA: hypothetical protein VHQ04_01025 [Puia sp.]|jgi:hypothetical protein|nr:hypothetical protein [Puia sp.]